MRELINPSIARVTVQKITWSKNGEEILKVKKLI